MADEPANIYGSILELGQIVSHSSQSKVEVQHIVGDAIVDAIRLVFDSTHDHRCWVYNLFVRPDRDIGRKIRKTFGHGKSLSNSE